MIPNEKRINAVESRVSNIETKIDMFMRAQDEKFNNFMQEMRDFKTEMRDRDNQRAAEIMELRQDMKNMQASLDSKIDGMGKHVRNLSVATIIGVATIAITVIYSILTR